MQSLLPLTFILVVSLVSPNKEQFPFRDEYPLSRDVDQSVFGSAELAVEKQKLKVTDALLVDIRFRNQGYGGYAYNPFFVGSAPFSGALVLYDAKKNYVGNYLVQERTINMANHPRVYIPNAGYVGCKLEFTAGNMPRSPMKDRPLKPGGYHLQMIYYSAFVTFDKVIEKGVTNDELLHFYDKFNRSELFRSNVVEIELVE